MRRAGWCLALMTCLPGHVLGSMSEETAVAGGLAELPRAVQRRLELWLKPPGGQLRARYRLTRQSSLLYEPLVVQGELVFAAPGRLELRDDEASGATTTIAGDALTIVANDPKLAETGPAPDSPGRRWLQGHLLVLLGADDVEALRQAARLRVLRGGALELCPTPGHPARQVVRELRISLDPASGELTELVLVEASGDVVTLTLSEHRR